MRDQPCLAYIILLFTTLFLASCDRLIKVDKVNPISGLHEVYFIDADSIIQGEKIVRINNQIYERANYINGVLSGERRIFFADGNVEIIEKYSEGLLIDTLKVFYPEGSIKVKMPYNRGVLEGEVLKYYNDGAIMEKVSFKENEENGTFEEYYTNGTMHWRGQYLNGPNEYGLLEEYDEQGRLLKKMMCDSNAVCRTIWTKENGDIVPL
jgi:antitoxin component YwqK of YwqJK toxin-antitoxin module